jgi:uncharacterized protein YggE
MPAGSALPTLRGLSRFATLRVAMAVVIVLGAMAGLALLAEAMNSGGGTVYLADLRQAESGAAGVPSLSVVGLGRATAPAERASIQLMFNVDPNQYYNGPPSPAEREGTPSAANKAEEAARPIVAAITAAGVPADAITVVTSGAFRSEFFGPGGPDTVSFRIDLALPNPQLEDVSAVIDSAQMAAQEMNLLLSPVGVAYGVEDCAPLKAAAWEAAVADAEARAAVQAERLGVRLGSVVAASESSPSDARALLEAESVSGSCVAGVPAEGSVYGLPLGNVTLPSFDPAGGADVVAIASVTVSYAIETE